MNKENKTVIEIGEKSLDYYRTNNSKISSQQGTLIYILTFVFLTISFLFACLQYFSWDPLYQLDKFKRIKTNMGNWRKLVEEKTAIEIANGRNLALREKSDIFNYKCYDFGLYYAAMKLNNKNYLPTFIKRGVGGIWLIKKAIDAENNKDISAEQFCQYVIDTYNNSDITCGTDMYDKMGYGGWFELGNPCQNALKIIENSN